MTKVWDESRVQQLIVDQIEESLNLDYKAALALEKTDRKRTDITKDVSAMANSDGGIIIYGVSEDDNNRHLPVQIDPVNRSDFSKEWLDNVISNIRPNIEGLIIHPVSVGGNQSDAIYVVEIPQSHTAHQALDKKYYKRVGFKSRPMEDYELRDVLNRLKYPLLDLTFRILRHLSEERVVESYELEVTMVNSGAVYARFVVAFLHVPCGLISDSTTRIDQGDIDPENLCEFSCENSLVDRNGSTMYVPVLPNLGKRLNRFSVVRNFEFVDWNSCEILWAVHADNAPPNYGSVVISEIEVVDLVE